MYEKVICIKVLLPVLLIFVNLRLYALATNNVEETQNIDVASVKLNSHSENSMKHKDEIQTNFRLKKDDTVLGNKLLAADNNFETSENGDLPRKINPTEIKDSFKKADSYISDKISQDQTFGGYGFDSLSADTRHEISKPDIVFGDISERHPATMEDKFYGPKDLYRRAVESSKTNCIVLLSFPSCPSAVTSSHTVFII